MAVLQLQLYIYIYIYLYVLHMISDFLTTVLMILKMVVLLSTIIPQQYVI